MAVKTLNIEIGDRLIKVCELARKGKSWHIGRCFMLQTPDNTVQDGQITDIDALAEALGNQLAFHEMGGVSSTVFTLVSGRIASREVTIPPVKDAKIKPIIDANAGEYFPVDITRYHVAYRLLERIDQGEEPGCRVLVMAAPLSLLEGYFRLAEKVGLSIETIDFSGNSQYQALRGLADNAATMFVNVDCTSSYVTIIKDGKQLMQRAFAFGGDELVLAYMNSAGKPSDEYVAALGECSEAPEAFFSHSPMTEDEVDDNLSRLVGSIMRSSDYFNSSHWDVQVEQIVLMGPCCKLVNLLTHVAEATGIDTVLLDDLPGVSSFANSADSASFYISCIGSAVAPLDFIPPQFKTAKKKRLRSDPDSLMPGVLTCALCVVVAVALCVTAVIGLKDAKHEKAALESEIASLQYAADERDLCYAYQSGADSLIALSSAIECPNDELVDFIEELEQRMPSQIIVLSAVCTRDGASLNVTVPSYDEAAVVLVQLRSFESLSDVQISAIAEAEDESGGSYCSFSVNCVYGVNFNLHPELAAGGAAEG